MRGLLYFLLLISCFSHAESITVENESFAKLNSLLSLGLPNRKGEKASGDYSINEQGTLDVGFHIGNESSGYIEELEANYNFLNNVQGYFNNGIKDGLWKYSYTYDDGIDLYESHTIEILYANNACVESGFKGSMGHIMSVTKHAFKKSTLCNPQAIRDKAWELWGDKYKELVRAGKL